MKKRLLTSIFCVIALACIGVFACSQNTSAEAAKRMCGTFSYKIGDQGNFTKSFQVCGTVDDKDEFVNNLILRNDDWDDSIVAVSLNSNIINFRTNANWWASDDFQVQAKPKTDFHDTLQSIKRGLESLGERRYKEGFKATFSDFSITTESATAESNDVIATNKAICENGGGTWSGDDASGYTCSNNDSLNLGPSSSSSGSGNACYSNATTLGWILCPVIDAGTGAINSIYGELEKNYLQIDVSNIFDSSSGVETAWATFRDIANIIFIVLFVVVILSQLTGFGIDNYGIKKILPKIIVVAVLINLSYIICQLAVDVSNIIGVSLRGFLEGLIPSNTIAGANANGAQWTVTLAGGAIAIGAAIAATGGIGLLIAILGAVITAVVAVFFLWLILVIRSAGIVILIAIAPLAIACYLLPNTEKLGKRWLDISKALLVLYPLCSLVVGAGALAGHILSYSNSDVMQLAAMIVQVVPFFFIPMLLRKSLDGMGSIGARINNFGRAQGRNLSGRASNAVNDSNFARNRRFNAAQRRTSLRLRVAGHANSSNGNRFTRGLARVVGGSRQTQSRLADQRAAMQNEERKIAANSWRDEYGNIQLGAVQNEVKALQAKADANGGKLNRNDTIRMQAALDTWGNIHAASLTEEIKGSGSIPGGLSGAALDYVQSSGELMSAVSKEDQVAGKFLKDRSNPSNGVTTYGAWSPSNEIAAIQSLGAKKLLGQDKDVIVKQAKHYTKQQFQDMKSIPGALGNLDEAARVEVVNQARALYGIDLENP